MSPRVRAAEAILRREGLAGARVRPAGVEDEIAAISAPPELLPALSELAPSIRAVGFRFVALELDP